MSYEQYMKHWKNHRKDRLYQQCSGYGGDGVSHQKTEKEVQDLAIASFKKLLEQAKTVVFPIYISECGGGYYCIVDERNLFGQKIDSYEELVQFGKDYIGCEPSSQAIGLDARIALAEKTVPVRSPGEEEKTNDTR